MGSKRTQPTWRMICLIIAFFVGLGGLSALAADDDMEAVDRIERILELHSDILDDSYELFSVQELRMPLAKYAYLFAKKFGETHEIRTAAEFSRVVKTIQTAGDALELARLLSSQELRPFLQDVFYAEVRQKIETESKDTIVDPWFRLDAEEYEALHLHAPVVTEKEGSFNIERFVASYPREEEDSENILPAQLLKIWERIDNEGRYSMEIREIVTEGEQIQSILLFTK